MSDESAAGSSAAWSLSQHDRDATVETLANNISTIAFFKGLDISDDVVGTAAAAAEKKAYNAALVAARTTTGNRPAAETTSAYARYVSELPMPSGGKEAGLILSVCCTVAARGLQAVDNCRKLGELVLAAVASNAERKAPATAEAPVSSAEVS